MTEDLIMNTQRMISKAATIVIFASLATAVAPALAAGPGGGDSGSESALGGANATGNKTMSPGAPNGVVGHGQAMANRSGDDMGMDNGSRMGSTTGSGMGGAGTTESNPSNTR
jgi:hypothetical protein